MHLRPGLVAIKLECALRLVIRRIDPSDGQRAGFSYEKFASSGSRGSPDRVAASVAKLEMVWLLLPCDRRNLRGHEWRSIRDGASVGRLTISGAQMCP